MTEDEQSLARQAQDQIARSARDFFGRSLGRLRSQLQDDRSQLEYLAEQLCQEQARARVKELIDSYSRIDGAIDEAARDLDIEAIPDEAGPQARVAEVQEGQRITVGRTAQGAQDTVAGALGQAAGLAGQVVGQVGYVAENLPGGQLLSRTTDGSGRTVQRIADASGDIIEATLDESNDLLDEYLVDHVTDLPVEEESTTEEGHTLRTVEDESGAQIRLRQGPDGSVLDVNVSPGA